MFLCMCMEIHSTTKLRLIFFWINKGTKRMAFEVESPVALHDWRGS